MNTVITQSPERRGGGWRTYARSIRVHQWAKNLLVFMPLITAGLVLHPDALGRLFLVFLAFNCVASGGYLVNDLRDLEADRRHPTKRNRPLASGAMPLSHGYIGAFVLTIGGLALAVYIKPLVGLMLLGYLVLTLTYSFALKKVIVVDAVTLAALYAMRVFAGAAAIEVHPSPWLLAFCTFLFFSLALVKRCTELIIVADAQQLEAHGRDYRVLDAPYLQSMGIASGYIAVLVIALYLDSESALSQYRNPQFLWAMCPLFLYWVSRLWIKTGRHEMHDDPLVYSFKDRTSWIFFISVACVWGLARF